ncbi:phospholipase D family protein [Variovorax sp. RB3P1]|uniref:phospholipase D family protein n=1 Tax=Variovorax sp. RB3P1 TaxID=3443732 RepID=UPI003F44F260
MHARLELARRATRTLDVQYYLVQNDETGRMFLRALRNAARRGVRVRLLLDDLHTAGSDALLEALAAEPRVEIRLFNPFPAARGHMTTRVLASLFDIGRLHRRMHNKLFIAEASMAVVGGRNIANEYFLAAATSNFIDIDALVAGAIVPRLAGFFDAYWDSPYVYPLSDVVPRSDAPPRLRERFETMTARATPAGPMPQAPDLLGNRPLSADLDDGRLPLTWATAEAYCDAPGKALGPPHGSDWTRGEVPAPAEVPEGVRFNVRRLIRSARHEVVQTTPYLVPGEGGMATVRMLRARGVAYTLVTNSLAGTDASIVHAGYQRYRPALLAAGVRLYELSPRRMALARHGGRFASEGGRLHGKSVVVDRRALYLGSLNFDPRSERYNTELGIIAYSPELAGQLLALVSLIARETAYEVRLRSAGLQWSAPLKDPADHRADGGDRGHDGHGDPEHDGQRDGGEQVLDEEPETALWKRLVLKLLGPLVPESIL